MYIYSCGEWWARKLKKNQNQKQSMCLWSDWRATAHQRNHSREVLLEIGSSLFSSQVVERKTQMTNINWPLSVLFCSVLAKWVGGNCMLQPSTDASKRKRKITHSALFLPSAGVSTHSSRTIRKGTIGMQVSLQKRMRGVALDSGSACAEKI